MADTKAITAHIPMPAYVDQEEERSRLTREALADVDAGRVIDHQAVQAWADSKPESIQQKQGARDASAGT